MMAEPLRVYLTGPAGSGKTQAAEILRRDHGLPRVSLGDVCREECRRLGWPEDRVHLQAAGDRLRGADPAGVALAAGVLDTRGPLVVDGVRLAAEAVLLRAHGFLGVRIDAPAAVRAARLAVRDGCPAVPDHPTESGIVPTDLRLPNVGQDPAELRRSVRLLVARLALLRAERATARPFDRDRP